MFSNFRESYRNIVACVIFPIMEYRMHPKYYGLDSYIVT